MPLQPLPSNYSRRALLITPIVFAGLAAFCYPRERELPDAATDGSGPRVRLAIFSRNGSCEAVIVVRKLIQSDAEWRKRLTSEQYAITRRRGTEFAFANRYWNNHKAGFYRCVCCGNTLFRSQDKFDSGTGWPSFSAPVAKENIDTRLDASLSMKRIEVLCRKCDAHLGHLFDDGPPPSGSRFCLNSVALRFVAYA
ncbi:MAG: peptide-methionine (R)-S-oxide reductase MsrB [Bryobacteraceae bacterium]